MLHRKIKIVCAIKTPPAARGRTGRGGTRSTNQTPNGAGEIVPVITSLVDQFLVVRFFLGSHRLRGLDVAMLRNIRGLDLLAAKRLLFSGAVCRRISHEKWIFPHS